MLRRGAIPLVVGADDGKHTATKELIMTKSYKTKAGREIRPCVAEVKNNAATTEQSETIYSKMIDPTLVRNAIDMRCAKLPKLREWIKNADIIVYRDVKTQQEVMLWGHFKLRDASEADKPLEGSLLVLKGDIYSVDVFALAVGCGKLKDASLEQKTTEMTAFTRLIYAIRVCNPCGRGKTEAVDADGMSKVLKMNDCGDNGKIEVDEDLLLSLEKPEVRQAITMADVITAVDRRSGEAVHLWGKRFLQADCDASQSKKAIEVSFKLDIESVEFAYLNVFTSVLKGVLPHFADDKLLAFKQNPA